MRVVGIDEAGRGCWAGPLVAAAVILDKPIDGLKDSKKLSRAQRVKLAELIRSKALAVSTGWVSAGEVDELGLTAATTKAMSLAIQRLGSDYDQIIIDGNLNYLPSLDNVQTLVGADALRPEVSAASIIAKTERDQYMYEMAVKFPKYQFEKHVGYGTARHLEMLRLYGICELHRLSYKPLRQLLERSSV